MAQASVHPFPGGFSPDKLDDGFFSEVLHKIQPNSKLVKFEQVEMDSSDSILTTLSTEIAQHATSSYVGFLKYRLIYVDDMQNNQTKNIVIKSKLPSQFLQDLPEKIAGTAAPEIKALMKKHPIFVTPGSVEHREIAFYNLDIATFSAILPEVYLTVDDAANHTFLIVMDDLRDGSYELIKTTDDIEQWSTRDIEDVMKCLASFHAHFMGRTETIPHTLKQFLKPPLTSEIMRNGQPYFHQLFLHNAQHLPEIYDAEFCKILSHCIENIGAIYTKVYGAPYTLIHNDCQPRNLCLRKSPEDGKSRLCLYDWEICSISIAQRDVVDFLANVLPPNARPEQWHRYRDVYQQSLEAELKRIGNWSSDIAKAVSYDQFCHIFDLCVVDLMIDRYSLYVFFHVYMPHAFFVRVMQNVVEYIKSLKGLLMDLN